MRYVLTIVCAGIFLISGCAGNEQSAPAPGTEKNAGAEFVKNTVARSVVETTFKNLFLIGA